MTACRVRRYFDPDGGAGTTQAMPQQFTSWEAIYETLRATFPDDRYHMGAAVSDVEQQGSQVIATLNGERKVTSDLLLAADGANSALRHRFVPDAAPSYAGYVAWRGTLEDVVPGNVARIYARMGRDLRDGTHTAPSFEDAVAVQRVIAAIERAAESGSRTVLACPGAKRGPSP